MDLLMCNDSSWRRSGMYMSGAEKVRGTVSTDRNGLGGKICIQV